MGWVSCSGAETPAESWSLTSLPEPYCSFDPCRSYHSRLSSCAAEMTAWVGFGSLAHTTPFLMHILGAGSASSPTRALTQPCPKATCASASLNMVRAFLLARASNHARSVKEDSRPKAQQNGQRTLLPILGSAIAAFCLKVMSTVGVLKNENLRVTGLSARKVSNSSPV